MNAVYYVSCLEMFSCYERGVLHYVSCVDTFSVESGLSADATWLAVFPRRNPHCMVIAFLNSSAMIVYFGYICTSGRTA